MTPTVLFEAEGFFAVHKPAGVLVIPGRGEDSEPSLRECLEAERGAKVWVVHRLDRDTSGVLLFAKSAEAHRSLSMAFEAGQIAKQYLALVEGDVQGPLRLDRALVAARRGRMRPARPGELHAKDALTLVTPLERLRKFTLVRAEPLTGRTHQIRVHLADAGFPLAFDHQYGRGEPLRASDLGGQGSEALLSRTPLHASRLTVPALVGVGAAEIEAPLPKDLSAVLALLRHAASAER